MKILIFDTETTGLPRIRAMDPYKSGRNWPDLVSICWIILESAGPSDLPHTSSIEIKRRYALIRPDGWTIPEESTKIHGITHEKATREGEDMRPVLADFKKDLEESRWVIAHNLEFDRNVMINAYYWRLRDDPMRFWDKSKEFCSMLQASQEFNIRGANGKLKWPRLDDMYERTCGRPAPQGAHNAERDVDVLREVVCIRWFDSLTIE